MKFTRCIITSSKGDCYTCAIMFRLMWTTNIHSLSPSSLYLSSILSRMPSSSWRTVTDPVSCTEKSVDCVSSAHVKESMRKADRFQVLAYLRHSLHFGIAWSLNRNPKWRVHSNGRVEVKNITLSIHWNTNRVEVIIRNIECAYIYIYVTPFKTSRKRSYLK